MSDEPQSNDSLKSSVPLPVSGYAGLVSAFRRTPIGCCNGYNPGVRIIIGRLCCILSSVASLSDHATFGID